MSDIKIDIMAKELGKTLEGLAESTEQQLLQAVDGLAESTYAGIVARVQQMSMNPNNRKDYLKGLNYQKIGDSEWLMWLDGDWAQKLEEGFEPYDLKDKLLDSDKVVGVGPRAGEPWVRKSKKGTRYAAVPFEVRPFSKEQLSGDLATDIQKLQATNPKTQKVQKLTQIFKDASGTPLIGKVASVQDVPGHPNLAGLTKFQHTYEGGATQSVYMTWRMVSDSSDGWNHPGHSGYQLFLEAERHVEEELKNILNTLL